MARARAEQHQAATGTTLIVAVGLGIAFLLFMPGEEEEGVSQSSPDSSTTH